MIRYVILFDTRGSLWYLTRPQDTLASLLKAYDVDSVANIRPWLDIKPRIFRDIDSLAPFESTVLEASRLILVHIDREGEESEHRTYARQSVYVWTGKAESKARVLPAYFAMVARARKVPTVGLDWTGSVVEQAPARIALPTDETPSMTKEAVRARMVARLACRREIEA